jgi:hypothetical protein
MHAEYRLLSDLLFKILLVPLLEESTEFQL